MSKLDRLSIFDAVAITAVMVGSLIIGLALRLAVPAMLIWWVVK